MSKFKVGEKVKIKTLNEAEIDRLDRSFGWVSSMEDCCGKTGNVSGIILSESRAYEYEVDGWWWPDWALEKAPMKVRIVKSIIVEMTEEEYQDLREAVFKDGDTKYLREMVDIDYYGDLVIEKVEE